MFSTQTRLGSGRAQSWLREAGTELRPRSRAKEGRDALPSEAQPSRAQARPEPGEPGKGRAGESTCICILNLASISMAGKSLRAVSTQLSPLPALHPLPAPSCLSPLLRLSLCSLRTVSLGKWRQRGDSHEPASPLLLLLPPPPCSPFPAPSPALPLFPPPAPGLRRSRCRVRVSLSPSPPPQPRMRWKEIVSELFVSTTADGN